MVADSNLIPHLVCALLYLFPYTLLLLQVHNAMCDAIRRHCVELGISFAAPDQHVLVKIDNSSSPQQSQVRCCMQS
jgi:hypothetical protein